MFLRSLAPSPPPPAPLLPGPAARGARAEGASPRLHRGAAAGPAGGRNLRPRILLSSSGLLTLKCTFHIFLPEQNPLKDHKPATTHGRQSAWGDTLRVPGPRSPKFHQQQVPSVQPTDTGSGGSHESLLLPLSLRSLLHTGRCSDRKYPSLSTFPASIFLQLLQAQRFAPAP